MPPWYHLVSRTPHGVRLGGCKWRADGRTLSTLALSREPPGANYSAVRFCKFCVCKNAPLPRPARKSFPAAPPLPVFSDPGSLKGLNAAYSSSSSPFTKVVRQLYSGRREVVKGRGAIARTRRPTPVPRTERAGRAGLRRGRTPPEDWARWRRGSAGRLPCRRPDAARLRRRSRLE